MKNTLVIATEPTHSLNFLIYLQNIYLNQSGVKEEFKFPYMPNHYEFNEEFHSDFNNLWTEITQQLSEHITNDLRLFHEEKDLFYERLFVKSAHNYDEFLAIYESFNVWWGSFVGHFAVERFVFDEVSNLYKELATLLKEQKIVPKKQLHISLLYDECLLGESEMIPYYAVIPINDFILKASNMLPRLYDYIKCGGEGGIA